MAPQGPDLHHQFIPFFEQTDFALLGEGHVEVDFVVVVHFGERIGTTGAGNRGRVGVSLDDDGWSVVRPWLQEHKVRYPVVLGDEDIGRLYGSMEALPVTFVIGRDGKIAAIHAGLIPKADYEKEIVRLLN